MIHRIRNIFRSNNKKQTQIMYFISILIFLREENRIKWGGIRVKLEKEMVRKSGEKEKSSRHTPPFLPSLWKLLMLCSDSHSYFLVLPLSPKENTTQSTYPGSQYPNPTTSTLTLTHETTSFLPTFSLTSLAIWSGMITRWHPPEWPS